MDRLSVAGDQSVRRTKRGALATGTDEELLRRCRGGDAAAWDVLVTRYERLVYSVALRNGLDAEEAADVTQTTFLTLVDSIDRVRETGRIASWLMTVARRQAWRARHARRRTVPLESAPEQADDPFADWGTLTVLHEALGALGDTCRELLTALYFDTREPSYAEIAQRFGRAVGGIGPLRGRCLARLRELMAIGESA